MFLSCESICEDLDGGMYINNYYVSAALMKPKRLKQFLVLCQDLSAAFCDDSACVLRHTHTHTHTVQVPCEQCYLTT